MPVDRPRRALLEELDNVESYVAKRSLGFTQADSGDRIVVRPARAAGAFEPSTVTSQTQLADRDHLATTDPPRRALAAELFNWDLDKEEPAPRDTAAAGRRAILDLESIEPTRPSEPALPAVEPQIALTSSQPRRSEPSPSLEPLVELAKIASLEIPPPDPRPATPQPATPIVAPTAPTREPEQLQPYRPTRPIDPPTSLPEASPVILPTSQITRPAPIRPASTVRAGDPPASTVTRPTPALRQAQGAAEIKSDPPAPTVTRPTPGLRQAQGAAPTPALRQAQGAIVRSPAAPAVGRARSSRPTVHHDVPPIIIDRLIKSYNGRLAVRNLSFVVEPGRVTGFLGPNGAGKTTTMRILVGLVTPTTGTATFGKLAYADLPHPQRTVGCVLDARFHPGRSGRNHLRVLAPTAGASGRRVDELLGEVGLGEVARQPVGEYSMGMQQRLALAAAMLGDPDYLILDEPANSLDPEGIRWLRTFLRDFAASGRAVLISSHLLNEIEATADDIVVINRGRLLAQMPMSELNVGEGITRVRVPDLRATLRALSAVGAEVETAADEHGAYLRILSHDVSQVGSVLFGAGIVVDELVTERRDLEQEFFSMLEGSR
jgi:ABC-2 type transport system ATP-binding protein